MKTYIGQFDYDFGTGAIRPSSKDVMNFLGVLGNFKYKLSVNSSKIKEVNKDLDGAIYLATEIKTDVGKFLNNFCDYTEPETVDAINAAIDDALLMLNDAKINETDAVKKCAAFPKAFQKFVDIIPMVIAIENSKYEKCTSHEYEYIDGTSTTGLETATYRCKHCGQVKYTEREWDKDDWGDYSEHDWDMLTR